MANRRKGVIPLAFQDQTLTCRDCGNPFVWTASEQEFYASKGFQNAPVRCPSCRASKRARMDGDRGPRQMYEITCSNCGKKDMVPFQPRGDRPVLCSDCFKKQREGGVDSAPAHEHSHKDEAPAAEEAPVVEETPTEEKVEEPAAE